MSSAIQRRGGTTAQHSTFTGLARELTIDTDKKTVVVHDGSTAGGFPLPTLGGAQSFTKAQRGAIVALTDGATITPDFSLGNHYSVTLGGNRTLANPTNLVAGQSGSIFITQDGTGSRTLAYGSYFKFPAGVAPTLTTTAGAVDRIDYIVLTSSIIQCVFTGNAS